MRSKLFCSAVVLAAAAFGQGTQVLTVEPEPLVKARRGTEVQVPLRVVIRDGYHINSNAPAEDYLIPTALTWTAGPLLPKEVTYPKAESVKYEFATKPLLVYSGTVKLVSRLAVAGDAPKGETRLNGKLRYQACTDKMCLPPKTLDVTVPVTIE